jgi:hypothetical protein
MGKGFHIRFNNGWTVSVQFGAGNYCDHYGRFEISASWYRGEARTAEIAAWDIEGNNYSFGDDTVAGYRTPAEVLEFMNTIAAL